jgi:hypothetical protein
VDQEGSKENWYVLLYGLEPEITPIRFTSGLSIKKLDAPLTVFDLAAIGASGFHAWATLEPFAMGCTCEIVSPQVKSDLPGFDALNRAWLLSALITLRGFGKHICLACSRYSWNIIAGHKEGAASRTALPPFEGDLLDYHLELLNERYSQTGCFTKDDALWIDRHFNSFNNIAAESGKFHFALEASIDWRYSKNSRAAISRIWSGIESIFGINTELVYRISLMAASLLSPRGPQRKEKFEMINEMYSNRSKAVHGEPLEDSVLLQTMEDSYHLLRDLLLFIVEKGRPLTRADFDDAIFS